MTEESNVTNQALIKTSRSISKIWLFPIIALIIGAWMAYYQWSNQGPLIVITFKTATDLEVGKTKIKTRDVEIGVVKKIELTEDLEGVLVTARLNNNVDPLLHKDNQFWIVSPRVTLNGISGLGTLLSGPYINMEPGVELEKSDEFIALPAPPVTKAGTPGLHVTLNSEDEFAYKKGDPVIYKGIKVGEFEDIYFNFDERVVYYNTFIKAPYHELITENTKFWDISGVNLDLSSSGVQVSTGSIETLLTNGVTFGVPEDIPTGKKITERSFFKVHSSYNLAVEERYKLNAEYVIFVKDTVRGLQVGAPVEYRGLVIGKVLAINANIYQQDTIQEEDHDIPVIIGIQPGRVKQPDTQQGIEAIRQQINTWVTRGLRASLKSGNLLTGALFVDLQHYSDIKPETVTSVLDYQVIPTISGEFSQITEKVSSILDNVNEIDLQQISKSAEQMLNQIQVMAATAERTADKLGIVLSTVEKEQVAGSLVETLDSISELTRSYSEDSETTQGLNQTLKTLHQTMKELQPLLIQLNNKPNSLIFTGSTVPTHLPRAKPLTNNGDK